MDYLCSECSTQLSKFEIELNTQFPIGKLYCQFCQSKKEREIIMAHKKGVGSSKNGRDSNAQRLGVKVSDGQSILSGGIILKQRGTKIHPGVNVKRANDDTLFATSNGVVKFARKGRNRKIVSVVNS